MKKFLKKNKMVFFLLILFAWLINGKTLEGFNNPRFSSECKECSVKWKAYHKYRREQVGKCAKNWNQVGEAGADITGCGLHSCNSSYRITNALTSESCAAYCKRKPNCNAYSWAPWNADKNYPWKKICTLYNKQPNTKISKLAGKYGKYRQVLCEKPQPKATGPSYKIVKSGASCEAAGMTSITTNEACMAAGLALGMSGKAKGDQPSGGYTYAGSGRAANCTVHNWELPEERGKSAVTQFFPKATGSCGKASFNCLCKGG